MDCLESGEFMTIAARLEQWRERGALSPEQHRLLAGLSCGEPFSLFLELNTLLYAGILAFVAGLGWTLRTLSQQLGDVLVLTLLSAMLAPSFWYCFSRTASWSAVETASPNLVFDYALYLGSLMWSLELAYLERRFYLPSGRSDFILLVDRGFTARRLSGKDKRWMSAGTTLLGLASANTITPSQTTESSDFHFGGGDFGGGGASSDF